jgi:hypothetical protein
VYRLWKSAFLASWLLGVAGAASAFPVTLTLMPSTVSLTAGQFVTVDIVVGGLFDEGEVALESFDLDLAFDNSRLLFTDVGYGGSLGDPEDSGETFVIAQTDPNANSVVRVNLFSLLTGPQLLALQSAPFLLATVEFQALAVPGAALLEFINLSSTSLGGIPGGAIGDELAAPSQLFVTVVPEPGAAVLLGAAVALLVRRARSARA